MTQWGLDTLFNPAKRHMDEEKRRLQSTREEIGDSSGGKRIDLESGKVTIRRDATAQDDAEDADDAATEQAAKKKEKKEKPAPSPAALRAAQRRGRQPR
jgi:Family of unknown function (DUF6191)